MKAKSFIVATEADLKQAKTALDATFVIGGKFNMILKNVENVRLDAQNKLAFAWYKEASKQKEDMTPKDIRAYCKLHIGVEIRQEDEEFREIYYRVVRPLTYEQKIEIMTEPINFPITRDMSVKQMSRYLDEMDMTFTKQGIILPKSDDNYFVAMGIKRK